jgi:hypothetical protein
LSTGRVNVSFVFGFACSLDVWTSVMKINFSRVKYIPQVLNFSEEPI